MATKKVSVIIDGYGREHTIGKLTNEQATFWKQKYDAELIDHVGFYDDNQELTDDQFIGPWYENDNIDHTYGAYYNIEVVIKFGDEEHTYKTKDYSLSELRKSETVVVDESKIEPGDYLVCFQEEKGNFINVELDVDENDKFNINDFEFITKEIRGEVFFTGVKYRGSEIEPHSKGTVAIDFYAEILSADELLAY